MKLVPKIELQKEKCLISLRPSFAIQLKNITESQPPSAEKAESIW